MRIIVLRQWTYFKHKDKFKDTRMASKLGFIAYEVNANLSTKITEE